MVGGGGGGRGGGGGGFRDTPQRFIRVVDAPKPLFTRSRLSQIYIFCCLVACSWAL